MCRMVSVGDAAIKKPLVPSGIFEPDSCVTTDFGSFSCASGLAHDILPLLRPLPLQSHWRTHHHSPPLQTLVLPVVFEASEIPVEAAFRRSSGSSFELAGSKHLSPVPHGTPIRRGPKADPSPARSIRSNRPGDGDSRPLRHSPVRRIRRTHFEGRHRLPVRNHFEYLDRKSTRLNSSH